MVERVFNSGDVVGENSIQRQIELVTRISQTSDVLSLYLEEGVTWHLKAIKFKRPSPILLGGRDMSEKVYKMAQQTPELLVRLHSLPEISNENIQQVPSDVWEIYPPHDGNFPGLGLTVVCPQSKKVVAPDELGAHRKSGSIDVVDVLWFEDGEDRYDRTKPESVLLRVIEKHPTASLKTALWFLESLHTAKEISHEKVPFKFFELENGI